MQKQHLLVGCALTLVLACTDGANLYTVGPAFDISDAVHGAGNEHFYWLPPTVPPPPPAVAGTFDGGLLGLLSIDICEIDGAYPRSPDDCLVLRTLDDSSTPEPIRVNAGAENYSATWRSTDGTDFVANATYRAFVSADGRVLGFIDLTAVSRQRDARNVPAGTVGLVIGRPFVFKFRVETAVPGMVVVTPSNPTIENNQLQVFTATITDLHGAALQGVTVDWAIDDASIAMLSASSGTTDASDQTMTAAMALGPLGTTTVRATSHGAEGTAVLTVESPTTVETDLECSTTPFGFIEFENLTQGGTTDPVQGDEVRFTVSIFNNGPYDAEDVEVAIYFPVNKFAYDVSSATGAPVDDADADDSVDGDNIGELVFTIAALADGATVNLQFDLFVDPNAQGGGTVAAEVFATPGYTDPDSQAGNLSVSFDVATGNLDASPAEDDECYVPFLNLGS